MKAEELRSKSEDELNKMVLDMRKEQFNLRFQKTNGQLENTAQMRGLRRDIARAKTLSAELAAGVNKDVKSVAKKAPAKKAEKTETKPAAKKTTAKKTPAKKVPAKKEEK